MDALAFTARRREGRNDFVSDAQGGVERRATFGVRGVGRAKCDDFANELMTGYDSVFW